MTPLLDRQTLPPARKQAPGTHLPTFFIAMILVPRPFHCGSDPADVRPSRVLRRPAGHKGKSRGPAHRHLPAAPCRAPALGARIRPGGARTQRREKPPRGPAVPQQRAPPALAGAASRLNHPELHVKSPRRAGHAGKARLPARRPGPRRALPDTPHPPEGEPCLRPG